MQVRGTREAFGQPGMEPRWSHSNKDGVGTAYSADSRLWFTLWKGIVTEVYYPTIDQPQLRDLEFLVTDGVSFFHEEKRQLESHTERHFENALGYRVTSVDPQAGYTLDKEVISDPHLPCLLIHVRLTTRRSPSLPKLRLFALAAPHLEVGGWGNTARVLEVLGRDVLTAQKGGTALAMAATVPFARSSVGFVGKSDGWTDLAENYQLDWEFDTATNGNVALIGEIPVHDRQEFTLGLALGRTLASAITTLFQSLGGPFEEHRQRFVEQWDRVARSRRPIEGATGDGGRLYHSSQSMMLAHEDKVFPGAFIASLSIPWGSTKGDNDRGGYHLVWTRDMVNTASALLATGSLEAPLRALIYLATQQQADGGFPQNFWVDGRAYWQGIQLDEVAYPIILASRLHRARALQQFDPYPLVRSAARFLIEHGPATDQDRWEEISGYSPSTLAICIAALTCAAGMARQRGDVATAQFMQEHADFMECHIEPWTVTTTGTLVPGIRRHYVRIRPVSVRDPTPDESEDMGTVQLPNLEPGTPNVFPANQIVDGGFLELVRYGVRPPDDPIILDSLLVVDKILKVDTPRGPVWRRYNHDGYGQRDDGRGYQEWGQGRAWPLLTGERGHYELAAGGDPKPYLLAMERFATSTGLLPEQVWDEVSRQEMHLELGMATEAALPLVWAHAEYVKLARSIADGKVVDWIPEVANRYASRKRRPPPREVWKFSRQPTILPLGWPLRIQAGAPFTLHWSEDAWQSSHDLASTPTSLGLHFVDLPPLEGSLGAYTFTFYWPDSQRWEGRDFSIQSGKLRAI
jgi:glucoamylase